MAGGYAGFAADINPYCTFPFMAGYRYQRLDYTETRNLWWGNSQMVDISKEYNRLTLSAGLVFH